MAALHSESGPFIGLELVMDQHEHQRRTADLCLPWSSQNGQYACAAANLGKDQFGRCDGDPDRAIARRPCALR